jgi:hypothetical protein
VGSEEVSYITVDVSLKGILGPSSLLSVSLSLSLPSFALPSSPLSLLPVHYELARKERHRVKKFSLPWSYHEPKGNRAKKVWIETSDTLSQNKYFLLLSYLSQIFFCHSNGKLTHF